MNDKNRVTFKVKRKHANNNIQIKVYFNQYLCKILGFKDKDSSGFWFSERNKEFHFTKKTYIYEAEYEPNEHAYTPKSLIVTSDVVEDTIFGGEHLKLLRLITNKLERIGDTIKYDFLHDEYVDLKTHEFERIKLRISDVTGGLLKVDYGETS